MLVEGQSVAQTRNAKNGIDMNQIEKGESFKIALRTVRASFLAQIVSHVQSARSHFQRWPCPNLEPKKTYDFGEQMPSNLGVATVTTEKMVVLWLRKPI